MEQSIRNIMTKLGIYGRTKGFFFLIEAVEICVKSGGEYVKMTEDIYPAVAKRFRTTAANAERSIRYTISELYKGSVTDYYIELFGDPKKRRKPTNREFIETVAYETAKELSRQKDDTRLTTTQDTTVRCF